jgi:hypothetical protein
VPLPFTRPATAVALALAVGLFALPACKKKSKPTEAPPNATPSAPTTDMPGAGASGPTASASGYVPPPPPRTPVFGAQGPRVAAARATVEGNLRQILIAMQNFHDANSALPGGYADRSGKPGLSWRVAVLPYIDQDALFKQFKLDEPWDSEHNRTLIPQMPKVFAPANESTSGYTFVRGFTGPGTWLPPQAQAGRPGQPLLGAKMGQITDGTSNTALLADAGEPVIWTKPDEMAFAPGRAPKLGGMFDSGVLVGLADGSVRFVRRNADPKLLPMLIQINDGGVVQFDD